MKMKHDLRLLGTSFVTIDYLNSPEVIDLQRTCTAFPIRVYVRACTHTCILTTYPHYTFLFLGEHWSSVVEVLSKSDIFTQVVIFVSKLHARCRSRIAKIFVLVSPNFRSKTVSVVLFCFLASGSDCSAVVIVSLYHSRRNLPRRTGHGHGCVRGQAGQLRSLCMLCQALGPSLHVHKIVRGSVAAIAVPMAWQCCINTERRRLITI